MLRRLGLTEFSKIKYIINALTSLSVSTFSANLRSAGDLKIFIIEVKVCNRQKSGLLLKNGSSDEGGVFFK